MGDLKGHLLPGSLFLALGLWWAVCCIKRYFASRQDGARYSSSATFTFPCGRGKLLTFPIECVVKIALSCFGMLAEILFNLPKPNMAVIQHSTMYFFFMMSGLVDLLVYFRVPLPLGTDFISLGLAFLIEGLLFSNHLHGREVLDVKIHILLVYVIFATVVVTCLEARYQRSVILTMSRAYLTMVQGSWFCAVGIILYGHGKNNTVWDVKSPEHAMQAAIYFSWHCAAHLVILLALMLIMSCCYRPQPAGNKTSDFSMTSLNGASTDVGYRMLTTADDDDDDDFEYEKPGHKRSGS